MTEADAFIFEVLEGEQWIETTRINHPRTVLGSETKGRLWRNVRPLVEPDDAGRDLSSSGGGDGGAE